MTQNERDKLKVIEALREAELEALKDKPDNENIKHAKSILSQMWRDFKSTPFDDFTKKDNE